MRRDELKPCPFCGGKPFIQPNGRLGYKYWEVVCDSECDFTGPARDTEEEAAAAWNRRSSAALSIEQTEPVKVKALEWDEFSTTARRHFQSNTILGQFQVSYLGEFECWQLYSPQKSRSWKENFSRHASSEAAKAAAQQDYEARIRSAIVGVEVDIPADLVERCSEIFGWKESGILTGDKLRGQARAIRENFNSVFDAGEALRQAEEETKREAMRFIIALSTTRIADSAEAGGSATDTTGGDHG